MGIVIGVVVGLVMGLALDSMGWASTLAVIGGGIGAWIQKQRSGAADSQPRAPAEQTDPIGELRQQVDELRRRVSALETRLSPGSVLSEARPPDVAPLPPAAAAAAITDTLRAATPPSPTESAGGSFSGDTLTDAAPPPVATPETIAADTPPLGDARPAPLAPVATAATATTQHEADEASWPEQLFVKAKQWFFRGNPIVKVGLLILFLGLAFLLRYATEHAVIPLEWRYAAVAATGVGLLHLGWRWRTRADAYGLLLQGGGLGVLYLTTLAGIKLHPLIPPAFGFGIFVALALGTVALAVLQDAVSLAVAAVLGGFAAPVLASTGSEHHLAFFLYLMLLNGGIVAIAWFKAWRVLNLLGFGCTAFLATTWGARYYTPELFAVAEPFLLLFFGGYVLVGFLFARRSWTDAPTTGTDAVHPGPVAALQRTPMVDASLVFGVPLVTFAQQYLLVRHFEYGPAYSALGFGLAYIALAWLLVRTTGKRYALLDETMIALGVVFASLSIPLGLETTWTSMAWAIEGAGLYWVGTRQRRPHVRVFALLLLLGALATFLGDVHVGSGAPVLVGSWLDAAVLALAVAAFVGQIHRAPPSALSQSEIDLSAWLLGAACLLAAAVPFLLWSMAPATSALALWSALLVAASARLMQPLLVRWGVIQLLWAGMLALYGLGTPWWQNSLSNATALVAAAALSVGLLWSYASAASTTTADRVKRGGAQLTTAVGAVFLAAVPLLVLPTGIGAALSALTSMLGIAWWQRRQPRAVWAAVAWTAGLIGIACLGVPEMKAVIEPDAAPAPNTPFWAVAAASAVAAAFVHRRRNGAQADELGWGLLGWALVWWGWCWWSWADAVATPPQATAWMIGVIALTAGACHWLGRRAIWPQLGRATLAYVPALTVLEIGMAIVGMPHPLAGWAALAWPAAWALHLVLLRGGTGPGAQLTGLAGMPHWLGVWLLAGVLSAELQWWLALWAGNNSSWALLGWLLPLVGCVWAVSSERVANLWPVRDCPGAYRGVAAAALVAVSLLNVAYGLSLGEAAAPLPYLPLVNPLELGQLAALGVAVLWWRAAASRGALARWTPWAAAVWSALAFAWLTSSVLRACHAWGGVPWTGDDLFGSALAQTSLSVTWSALAILLMWTAHRHRLRRLWIVGAALLGVVIVKLFVLELAAHGSLARIVSFIVVGLLLLLIGYVAPLPPRRSAESPQPDTGARA